MIPIAYPVLLLLVSTSSCFGVRGRHLLDGQQPPPPPLPPGDPPADPPEGMDQIRFGITDFWQRGKTEISRPDLQLLASRREQNLEKLQEIFGIRRQSERSPKHRIPPQFMMELYNTIVDPSGVARGRNPYNAKVVRSFIERDTSLSHFYFFNISGLEVNESILEAELHLYRKKMPLKSMHPSTLTSPYYLIRVYQVLDERSLDIPDLHRLLNVRYVGAHASGWQVFNVKQAVLSWVSGEPNLGLLVTASTLFEDKVEVEFSRRNEYHRSKQPILVLFDDDGTKEQRPDGTKIAPRYYAYDKNGDEDLDEEGQRQREEIDEENEEIDLDRHQRRKRNTKEQGEPEEPMLVDRPFEKRTPLFDRHKRKERRESSKTLTSIEVYERAMLRERLGEVARKRDITLSAFSRRKRSSKSATVAIQGEHQENTRKNSTAECTRHDLYVDFNEIGLSSSIIAPKGYSAYHCKGVCESPLSQDLQPTNHATVQSIVHKMGLVKGVERPCCVPTKLLSTTILFFDDNENVVLKMYEDMIADRCGCR